MGHLFTLLEKLNNIERDLAIMINSCDYPTAKIIKEYIKNTNRAAEKVTNAILSEKMAKHRRDTDLFM